MSRENRLGFEKDTFQSLPIQVTHQSLLLAGDGNCCCLKPFEQTPLHGNVFLSFMR